jgi:D-serine deaminase-like pyridoxal phosphate-dependent protein
MQDKANKHHVKLRPHIKTHKCAEIARLQMDQGAHGLTCAKSSEAITFLHAGFKNILVAAPIFSESKLEYLLKEFKEHDAILSLVFDHPLNLKPIMNAAKKIGYIPNVYLKVNVGLDRCGINENEKDKLDYILNVIHDTKHVHFIGILSHAGQSYGCGSKEQIREVIEQELKIMTNMKSKIEIRVPCPEVSIGSTPTCLLSEKFDGITEIRPGNYVFMDRLPLRLGLINVKDVSLMIVGTVVSTNDKYVIIDAGSKVFSSDKGAHGTSGDDTYGLVNIASSFPDGYPYRLTKLSEELGWIEVVSGEGAEQNQLTIGNRVRIVPNHSCPVANLAKELVIIQHTQVVGRWDVIARGNTQ